MSFKWIQTMFNRNNKPARRGETVRRTFRPGVMELEDRRVLATLFVGSNLTPGVAGTFNPGRFDATPVAAGSGFNSLSAAIAAANTNGDASNIIRVGTGTYSVAPGTNITKSLTIAGSRTVTSTSPLVTSPTPASFIIPSGDTQGQGSGNASAWFLLSAGTISVTTLDFNGGAFFIRNAFRTTDPFTGTASFDNVKFSNIKTPGVAYDGVAIVVQGGKVDVSNSTFNNIGRTGVAYFGATTTGTIMNVDYTGKGAGDQLDYGVDVQEGAKVIVTASSFINCSGVATADGSQSAGIEVFTTGSSLSAFGNLFKDNLIGAYAGFDNTDSAALTVNYNNFVGNSYSVFTTLASTADARFNYFGTAGTVPAFPATNGIQASGPGTITTTSPLFEKTWVWYGTSAQSYLDNTSFFTNGTNTSNPTDGTVRVYDGTTGTRFVGIRTDISGQTDRVMGISTTIPGATNGEILKLNPYNFGSPYIGGISVDIGDINGDYRPDVITGATVGGPHVRAYDILSGAPLASFYAFNSAFTGGVNVRAGDINGDGVDEIIVGKGPNKGAAAENQVRVFAYTTSAVDPTLIKGFSTYSATYTGGVNVGTGDVNADGKDEIVVGNSVLAADVRVLTYNPSGTGNGPGTFFAGPGNGLTPGGSFTVAGSVANPFPGFTGGVVVDVADTDGNGFGEVIIGVAANGAPHVVTQVLTNPGSGIAGGFSLSQSFYAFATSYTGGVAVGGARVKATTSAPNQILVAPNKTGINPTVNSAFQPATGTTPTTVVNGFNANPLFGGGAFVGG